MATGRKGKLVNGALSDRPLVDWVPSGLGLTSMNTEAFSLLEQLIDRGSVGTDDIIIVDVHASTCMGSQKTRWGPGNPFDAGNPSFINISLEKIKVCPLIFLCLVEKNPLRCVPLR